MRIAGLTLLGIGGALSLYALVRLGMLLFGIGGPSGRADPVVTVVLPAAGSLALGVVLLLVGSILQWKSQQPSSSSSSSSSD